MSDFRDGDLVLHDSGKMLCYGGEISNSPSFCYVFNMFRTDEKALMVDLLNKGIICKDEVHLMTSEEVEEALNKILDGAE